MRKRDLFFIITCCILLPCLWSSCDEPRSSLGGLSVTVSVDSIHASPAKTILSFHIENQTGVDLDGDNWLIGYNQLVGLVDLESTPAGLRMKSVGGDYIELKPDEGYELIENGGSRQYTFEVSGHVDKQSEMPVGIFAVIDGKPRDIAYSSKGMDEKTLTELNPTTAKTRYEKNKRLSTLDRDKLLPFIPSPTEYTYLDEEKVLGRVISVSASEGLDNEVQALSAGLKTRDISITSTSRDDADITIALRQLDDKAEDAYRMRVDNDGIVIISSSKSGIYYGIQSLLQYISYARQETEKDQISLRGIEVQDQARFDYRGMHLDVSRNFHRPASVKSLIDQMTAFKLNYLQMHVTDDEGWRIEIADLPELTDIGSKRGYTSDEEDHLMPSYGSGAIVEESYGTGYYTKEDYIDILSYASARHITVITEIDLPAHARAAIIAMRARYNRLHSEGNDVAAEQYRLDDPNDASVYRSAQNWDDNVICICKESAYTFAEKVISEVVEMYNEAGAPLDAIHIGGDDLPYGAWQKSPICAEFIAQQEDLSSSDDLPGYFFKRIKSIMDEHGLVTAGWEDMVLRHDEDAHESTSINPSFKGSGVRPYVWNAIIGGGREDMIYKLANAGFDVVMSNSSSYYFDMAYDKDPDEIGLSWSGYADTEKAYATDPLDMFHRLPDTNSDVTKEDFKDKVRLSREGKSNFLGIQAQLWSETVRDASSIEYLTYPKILGFAERAWSPAGPWMQETVTEKIEAAYEKQWNLFANTLGQKALPLLDQEGLEGLKYRIPEPGVTFVNGKVEANTSFPGLKIVYQKGLDGEPQEYSQPLSIDKNESLIFWSSSSKGRKGRPTTIN